jgi:signal transduction histidine kinase
LPIQLLITNIGFIVSFIICLGLGILVFVRRPPNSPANVVFFLLTLAICTWQVSYFFGINLSDPEASRLAFMFNLSALFIIVLNAHLLLLTSKRFEGQKKVIEIFYTIAIGLTVYFIIFPETLLLPSVPKIYLPNFFVPGPLYVLQDTFFFIVVIYFFIQMYLGYKNANHLDRNRLKYFNIAFIYAYVVSLVPEFLLYDIPVDPWPAAFTGLYVIPLAYAILKYNLIDINVLAKRSLGLALSVTGVTFFILLVGNMNNAIHEVIPNFPQWFLPLMSAILAVAVGIIVWRKIKELDMLKYQFVDVVTHRFRTPLTYIRWSLDTLRSAGEGHEKTKALNAIGDAHSRLSELTDALLGLSRTDTNEFIYSYDPHSLRQLVEEAVKSGDNRIQERNIHVEIDIPPDLPPVLVDRKKILFAVQMVIENAATYSKEGQKVEIEAEQKGDHAILTIRDHGIGIEKDDLGRLFSKFFRGENAVRIHTEGLGIGLYLARDIVRRHGGDLSAVSTGHGQGSTFTFKLPISK